MIAVTRLDGSPLVVNADLIEWIERTPDTLLVLTNGEKLLVRESPEILVERVMDYRRAIGAGPAVRVTREAEPGRGGIDG